MSIPCGTTACNGCVNFECTRGMRMFQCSCCLPVPKDQKIRDYIAALAKSINLSHMLEEISFDIYEREFSPFVAVRREGPRTEDEKNNLRELIRQQIKEDFAEANHAG